MGSLHVRDETDPATLRRFTTEVLRDLTGLERMLSAGMFETGVRRIGAEQEMVLVDDRFAPAPVADRVLDALRDPSFTTELARFNLEANLPPLPLEPGFLRALEAGLAEAVERADRHAEPYGARTLLTGILPTLRQDDLRKEMMTDQRRYRALNDALVRLRGEAFRVVVRGEEQLEVTSDSVMLEAANTSLQLHLQVDPDEFAPLYNLAQLVSAPLLAAAGNSPVLLGHRLWQETRVALFEGSVDARSNAQQARGHRPRVSFGEGWLRDSVVEVFRQDVARFPVIMVADDVPDPMTDIAAGRAPALVALTVHNGTVWRWNRPCYGVADGRAHLRIENRVLPSGPSVLDETANAALFYGVVFGLAAEAARIPDRIDFEAARNSLVQAAHHGLDAPIAWFDGTRRVASELLLDRLIPVAHDGLASVGVSIEDRRRYLGTIDERVRSGQTGARWILAGLGGPRRARGERARDVVAAALRHAAGGDPVHRWPPPAREARDPSGRPRTVDQLMSTDLFTVRPQDPLELATSVMDWEDVRHVPVEDDRGQLVGLVSHRGLFRLARHDAARGGSVEAAMDHTMVRVAPDTPVREALERLLKSESACLLVTDGDRLVGIVTERDFLREAADVLAG